ncbi:MAG: hypothetical protein MJZ50_01745 [Treponema sp.]|nr:hypothetical protein [Treponema sp.]
MADKITQEQKKILDSINDDNFMDYAGDPLFLNKPKGLNGKRSDTWNRYSFKLGELERQNQGKNVTSLSDDEKTSGFGKGAAGMVSVGAGSSSNEGKSGPVEKNTANMDLKDSIEEFKKYLNSNGKEVSAKTQLLGNQKNVDSNRGRTQDGYIGFSSLKLDKKNAERELDKAERANPRLQKYLSIQKDLQENLKQLKSNPNTGMSTADLKGSLSEVESAIKANDNAINEIQQSEEWINGTDDPDLKKRLQEFGDVQAQLSIQRQALVSQLEKQTAHEQLVPAFGELANQSLANTKAGIDAYGQWIKDGVPDTDAAYKLDIAQNITAKIGSFLEDGIITDEEESQLKDLFSGIDTLIDEERNTDSSIRNAQDKYDSARSKFSYYLFDQIKALAVLLVGLSSGNAQMVYSAMDLYNKKIADSEADFTTDEIKAFSNNNVKEIEGEADAQYAMQQLLPVFEQHAAFKELDSNDKAMAVDALFKAYQRYKADSQGYPDFAAWYTANSESSGNGWSGIIRDLIKAGALNSDLLDEVLSGKNKGNNKKGPGLSFNYDTKGKTDDIIDSVLQELNASPSVAMNTMETSRDKQGIINKVLQSRISGQGAVPQGQAGVQPVNSSWGQA